jgi:hypothetical protein
MVDDLSLEQATEEWGAMTKMPGADIMIQVERPVEKQEEGRTLSTEGMETLNRGLFYWVGTRMQRAMEEGVIPQTVTVHIHVALDGEAAK